MPATVAEAEQRFDAAEARVLAAASRLERTTLDIMEGVEGPAPAYLSQADRIGIIVDGIIAEQRAREH